MPIMPSQAIKNSFSKVNINNSNPHDTTWTDDLPRCRLSGVGTSQNQVYRENRSSYSAHEYEDQSIHFCIDPQKHTFLYGVFDGHDGTRASNFVSQKLPAELSFEQLEGKTNVDEIKEIFRQAFLSVETAFWELINQKIAERAQLLEKIPDNMIASEVAKQFPETYLRLEKLQEEIRGGTSAVVALIHEGILYIGNVGDSKALLCQKDKSGVLKVKQLTVDHNTNNHDELERLSELCLDSEKLKGSNIGNQNITRCLGNYFLKGGYKEYDVLAPAILEPVIAEPHITSIPIDESCSFLLLLSNGLYRSYEEVYGSTHANKNIAAMVAEGFLDQSTLASVAQTVVDRIVRDHHNAFLENGSNNPNRDDMTLLVRNFNFHLSNSYRPTTYMRSNIIGKHKERDSATSDSSSDDLTLCNLTSTSNENSLPQFRGPPRNFFSSEEPKNEGDSVGEFSTYTSGSSTESSRLSNPSLTQLTLDAEGCIEPYINFDSYYKKVKEAVANGTIPQSDIHLYM